jgi:hypothetical protein
MRELARIARAKGITAEPKKRGRHPGRGKELQNRIALVPLSTKYWYQRQMSRFLYPDTFASAYTNTRSLWSDHRGEILTAADAMTKEQAESELRKVGAI